jgi:polysaccharide pyruvyl transferase WcaK-like protein
LVKIVLVNVKFSANLGDGVIADCLEHALKQRLPGIEVVNCDLAGRTDYGDYNKLLRSLAIGVLPKMPARFRASVYPRLFELMVRRKLMPGYRRAMEHADIVLFGGGQLLEDTDLNFPMKIAAAASTARNLNLPIAIHAVGVGQAWSAEGEALFEEAFVGGNLIWTSVRDLLSQQRWRRNFNGADIAAPRLSLDPGLLGAITYGPGSTDAKPRRNRPLIGLCITNPATLKLHSDVVDEAIPAPDAEFYRACVKAIHANECDVLLFTNGAPDDEVYLQHSFPGPVLRKFDENQVRVAEVAKTPNDLVSTIRDCDGIVSHRLHASVIAYSYRIPHVGLSTNRKLDEFFATTGREDFLLRPSSVAPERVAAAIKRACQTPISDHAYQAIMRRVENDFDDLAGVLSKIRQRNRKHLALT